jgi:cellulose synthase/poly-beta-1,6-N-acetylglucosamine synthase-like glycosyltransferase
MFPEGDPAVANGKPSAELSGTVNGVGYQRSRSSAGQYRPVGAAFAIAPTVSVVIPVKNEARNLPIVFRTVPAWVDEVVLVDGRSVDDTLAVARRCRPDVKIVNQTGKGKGDALLAGFDAAQATLS